MDDTNIVLYLKNREEVKVIYPLRVFVEFHTPWLERQGSVQTSDPTRDLNTFLSGRDFVNANFVISTWKNFPKYQSSEDGRVRTIPMCKVSGITSADASDTEVGNKIRQQENKDMLDKYYRESFITREDLAKLFPDLADRILTRPKN